MQSLSENTYITKKVSDNLKDPAARAMEKFKAHPSVLTKIKSFKEISFHLLKFLNLKQKRK